MTNKAVDDYNHLYKTLTKTPNNLSEKSIRGIVKKLFTPILERDGYEINRDSMRRHGYLDYIASKGRGKYRQTIGVAFNKEEKNTTKDVIESLVAGCTIDGIDSVIFLSNTQVELNAEEYDKDLFPVKFQKFDFNALERWVGQIESRISDSSVIKILRECTQLVIKAVLENPDALDDLEWRDLERMIAELFKGLGFVVELTPPAKDGGKDLILELIEKNKKISYIVEIKHWRSRQEVGKSYLDNFVKVITKEKRKGGLFLSTYGVSNTAVESLTKIERKMVRFGDKEKILSLCETYIKNTSGLWLKDMELEKHLFKNTS